MSTLFDQLQVGTRVRVIFSGGIEGETTGRVSELLKGSTDFRITVETKFWDNLSRRYHYAGDVIIVHAKELKEILSNGR